MPAAAYALSRLPLTPGQWPSIGRPFIAPIFSSIAASPGDDAGEVHHLAQAVRRRRRRSSSRMSSASTSRRWSPWSVAGTQLGAMIVTSSGKPADASAMNRTPATPATLAISCGSATTRRHAARQHGGGELRRHAQAALDVDVGVDQPRRDVRAAEVDALRAFVSGPDARDPPAGDRDVDARLDFAGESVDDPPAGEAPGRPGCRHGRRRVTGVNAP